MRGYGCQKPEKGNTLVFHSSLNVAVNEKQDMEKLLEATLMRSWPYGETIAFPEPPAGTYTESTVEERVEKKERKTLVQSQDDMPRVVSDKDNDEVIKKLRQVLQRPQEWNFSPPQLSKSGRWERIATRPKGVVDCLVGGPDAHTHGDRQMSVYSVGDVAYIHCFREDCQKKQRQVHKCCHFYGPVSCHAEIDTGDPEFHTWTPTNVFAKMIANRREQGPPDMEPAADAKVEETHVYTWLDFVMDVASQIFENAEEAIRYLNLWATDRHVIRYIPLGAGGKPLWILTQDHDSLIVTDEISAVSSVTITISGKKKPLQIPLNKFIKDRPQSVPTYVRVVCDPMQTASNVFNRWVPLLSRPLSREDYPSSELLRGVVEQPAERPMDSTVPGYALTLFLFYLLRVLSKNDVDVFLWLLMWLKILICHPAIQTEKVIIFFSTKHGTGKSYFFRYLSKFLIGEHASKELSSISELEGQFNNFLVGKRLVLYNELWGDSKNFLKSWNTVKDLADKERFQVNQKFKDFVDHKNVCNQVGTTNQAHSAHIEKGDRRIMMQEISSEFELNKDGFFSALSAAIETVEFPNILATYLDRVVCGPYGDGRLGRDDPGVKLFTKGPALVTQTKKDVIDYSKTPVERFMDELQLQVEDFKSDGGDTGAVEWNYQEESIYLKGNIASVPSKTALLVFNKWLHTYAPGSKNVSAVAFGREMSKRFHLVGRDKHGSVFDLTKGKE
jgi:hypothetical protein